MTGAQDPGGKRNWEMVRRGVLVCATASLILALAVNWVVQVQSQAGAPANPFRLAAIPRELPGWQGRTLPLGPTERLAQDFESILNLNAFVYTEFRQGEKRIAVYCAYWRPGQMPIQVTAAHTPDRCWTKNGWKLLENRFSEEIGNDGSVLLPAQWRAFAPPGVDDEVCYVLFWHLVGNDLYDYGHRFQRLPSPLLWWQNAMQYAILGPQEQYFVRVTSNRPFGELNYDLGWRELVAALAKFGLEAARATGGED
ncbi:MAG: exosortase-associated EpsI family protein [Verrucomicrobia bacterium]|nr:exosortase-associated EpsI family protein [Verrucomicrobiota bacterium]